MSEKDFGQNDPKLLAYVEKVYQPDDAVLRRVRERQEKLGIRMIQVGRFDGLHLEVLARAIGAKNVVEIGTLAGYSGICLLRGMVPGGKLHTFEYEHKHAEAARESFKEAGFSEGRVRIHLGAALDNLPKIESEGPFDLVFIDADKENYPAYADWAARNLRVGGVILGDNAFAFGMLGDEEYDDAQDEQTVKCLRKFSETLAQSGRFRATMLPTGEGLAMGVKVR